MEERAQVHKNRREGQQLKPNACKTYGFGMEEHVQTNSRYARIAELRDLGMIDDNCIQ